MPYWWRALKGEVRRAIFGQPSPYHAPCQMCKHHIETLLIYVEWLDATQEQLRQCEEKIYRQRHELSRMEQALKRAKEGGA